MKAYKLELLVIDFDQIGGNSIKDVIENAGYSNDCINPSVESIQEADIGIWSDDHPLNHTDTAKAEYNRLFAEHSLSAQDEVLTDERQSCCGHDSDCSIHNAGCPELLGPCDCSVRAWEWAPNVKLGNDEIMFFSSIYQTAEGLPVMTDCDENGAWNVAIIFKRRADGVDYRHPVRIIPVDEAATPSPSLAVRDVVEPGKGLSADMERELFGDGEAGAGEG